MILQAVAAGLSSVQIGAQLHLSRQAVDYRIGQMLRALRVANRPQLVSKAYSLGFFAARSWPPEFSVEFIRES
jgi:DNA-binding NarL/FixJ family response regulator